MPNFLEADDTIFKKSLLLPNLLDPAGEGPAGPTGGPNGDGISNLRITPPPILTPGQRQEADQCKFIFPEPGKCVKTIDKKSSQKVFLNICHSEKVPEPVLNFTDEQLANLLSEGTDDQVDDVRIPISIGEKRVDADKGGSPCQVYDIVVNSKFYKEKILTSQLYWTFLCVVSMEALDEKYKLELERNKYIVMKNKACHGKLQPQFVRSKPAIREMSSTNFDSEQSSSGKKPLIEVVESTEFEESAAEKKLEVKFFQTEPGSGLAVVQMPGLKNLKNVTVKYAADEIKITSPVGKAHVKVPVNIDSSKSKHEFDAKEQKLSITIQFKEMTDSMLENWKKRGYDIYAFEKEYGMNLTMRDSASNKTESK